MAPPYTRNMRQDCTYWAPGVNDGFGKVTYLAPITFKCRWQDVAVLFRSGNGEEETSSSVVYVSQPVATQGYLARGDLTSNADNPEKINEAKQIRQIGSSPSLSNTQELLKVWL